MRSHHGSRSRRAGRRGGFTLIEIMVATVILTIGLGTGVYALLLSLNLERAVRERGAALQAAESVLEQVRNTTFNEVFLRYNATTADDPVTGVSPGPAFDVRGLRAAPGDPDGLPGEIFFPGDGITLDETLVDRDLGMPRDLDQDGAVGALTQDYAILPMRVRVRWTGANGVQEVVLSTVLNNERKL